MESAAPPLAPLPTDVWKLIISFVPPRPRLLRVSLVSKRWRQMVCESATSLPYRSMPSSVLARFPAITRLCEPSASETPLSSRITALVLNTRTSVAAAAGVTADSSISRLTALTIRHENKRVAFGRLVRASAASLTRLTLSSGKDSASTVCFELRDLDLPSLVDLTVCFPDSFAGTLLPLVSPRLSQLTSLRMAFVDVKSEQPLPGGLLTRLRHLEIPFVSALGLLPRCPSLTSLSCNVPLSWGLPRLRSMAHLRLDLACALQHANDSAALQAALAKMPVLTSLRLSAMRSSVNVPAVVNSLKSLRSLTYDGPREPLYHFCLPSLTRIAVNIHCDKPNDPFGVLTALVTHCPLRWITCDFRVANLPMLDRQIPEMESFLLVAEARGVDAILFRIEGVREGYAWLQRNFAKRFQSLHVVWSADREDTLEDLYDT